MSSTCNVRDASPVSMTRRVFTPEFWVRNVINIREVEVIAANASESGTAKPTCQKPGGSKIRLGVVDGSRRKRNSLQVTTDEDESGQE